jgi:hypothetical protein
MKRSNPTMKAAAVPAETVTDAGSAPVKSGREGDHA